MCSSSAGSSCRKGRSPRCRRPRGLSGPGRAGPGDEDVAHTTQVVQLVLQQTGVVDDLVARAERLSADEKSFYHGELLLYEAQLGTPKNKKLRKLLPEAGVQQ